MPKHTVEICKPRADHLRRETNSGPVDNCSIKLCTRSGDNQTYIRRDERAETVSTADSAKTKIQTDPDLYLLLFSCQLT